MKFFKNPQKFGWIVLFQTRSNSIHSVEEHFRLSVMQPFQKHSSWWLGRAPQHPLSRPSSFYGVKQSFLLEFMQTFNNVQMNGWSCSPNHGPVHITVLKKFFVWMLCGHFENFQVDGWAALPNIPCHGPTYFGLMLCRFSTASNERLVVLPQTRSSSKYAVGTTFRPDSVKFFRNIQNLGWVVLPQNRPSSFHGVEKPFRLDVMQPFQKHSSWWLSCAPQHPCHGPAHFAAFNIFVVLMLCRLSTTFKWTAGRAPPNAVQFISRC